MGAECGACSLPPFLCNSYFRGNGSSAQHPAELSPCLSQIVLAFGNYMNSSKRGAAYGFRLQSLDAVRGKRRGPLAWGMGQGWWPVAYQVLVQLLEMKSTDRKQTLLHYLVKVIAEKYPQLTGFHSELHFLDKAGAGRGAGTGRGGPRPAVGCGEGLSPGDFHGGGEKARGPQDVWPGMLHSDSLPLHWPSAPLSVPGQRPRGCALPAARPGVDPAGVCAAG